MLIFACAGAPDAASGAEDLEYIMRFYDDMEAR
jgi:hypothetical protein